jgi:hypothetical protein
MVAALRRGGAPLREHVFRDGVRIPSEAEMKEIKEAEVQEEELGVGRVVVMKRRYNIVVDEEVRYMAIDEIRALAKERWELIERMRMRMMNARMGEELQWRP